MPKFNDYPAISSVQPADTLLVYQQSTGTVRQANASAISGYQPTIAALKALALTGLADGTQINVQGYYAAGDGFGGVFQYSLASVATDNGGTVIAPTVGAGRWLRVFDGPVNAKWFGAKGSAFSQNDTPYLQAAWTFCNTTKRELYIPAGDYRLDTSLLITAEGVNISGDGRGTVLKLYGTAQGVLTLSGTAVRETITNIRDLYLTATSKTGTYGILFLTGASAQIKVNFTRISCDSLYVGFYAVGMQFCSTDMLVCNNCTVGVRLASDSTQGGGNNNLWKDLEVTGNTVGIVAYKDSVYPFHTNRFVNPIIFGNTVCGAYLEGFDTISFDGATPEDNATGAATFVFEGKTIKRGLWHLVSSQVLLDNYVHSSNVANSVNLESSSVLTIRNGVTSAFSSVVTDGTSSIIFEGNNRLFGQADNVVSTAGMTNSGASQIVDGTALASNDGTFYNEVPNDPCCPAPSNVIAPVTFVREVADSVGATGSNWGVVDSFQFSAGSFGAVYYAAIPIRLTNFSLGEKFYCSMMLRASVDCSLTINYAESTVSTTQLLKAGVWTKVVVAAEAVVNNRGAYVVIYSNTNAAPKVNVTRVFLSTFTTSYQLASLFQWQPFNFNLPARNYAAVDAGDAAYTVSFASPSTILYNTPITADRAVNLPADSFSLRGARYGARYRIVRTAAATGGFNVNVGTGPLKALAAGTWCDVEVDLAGNAFRLIGYGAL